MFKTFIAAAMASALIFSVTPASAATKEDVVLSCTTKSSTCLAVIKAYLASLPAAQRVEAARLLAAAFGDAAIAQPTLKAVFAAAIKGIGDDIASIDLALAQTLAGVAKTVNGGKTVSTASIGGTAASGA